MNGGNKTTEVSYVIEFPLPHSDDQPSPTQQSLITLLHNLIGIYLY